MSECTQQRWHTCVRVGNIYTEDGNLVVRANAILAQLDVITDHIIANHNACIGIVDPATTVPELVAVCRKVEAWLVRLAEQAETQAQQVSQFETIVEACTADAANYRATARSLTAILAKTNERKQP